MLVVVLNDWVTDTKETSCLSNSLDQLGEVGERTGQPIDLIDDDHVDPSGLNIGQQFLQRRPVHRPAGIAAVVVVIPDQSPALMRLALDVGLGGLPLGVEGVEVLFEPLVGRDPGIDRAAQDCPCSTGSFMAARLRRCSLPRRSLRSLPLPFRRSLASSAATVFPCRSPKKR